MSEILPKANDGQYFNCIPILTSNEVSLIQNIINKGSLVYETFNTFVRQADKSHQLDNIIRDAMTLHQFPNSIDVSEHERKNMMTGISDGYITTFGLFEMVNIIRRNRNSSDEAKPMFPLTVDEAAIVEFIQTERFNNFVIYENQHAISDNFYRYFNKSPSTIELLTQISEITYELKGFDDIEPLKTSYNLGFDQATDSVLYIYKHIHDNRMFSKISAMLLS
ncbi:MAG: hypothetical protein HIU83_11070 [Proteobacteria bacterium]|nr:hypothetical protein [Pseudomonadota bacterium]